jgi:hypothetical protein
MFRYLSPTQAEMYVFDGNIGRQLKKRNVAAVFAGSFATAAIGNE